MTTSSPLRGLWLPIVTPFRDGAVDLASYERLLRHYLELGIDGLFPLGITLASAGSHTEPGGYTGAGRENIHRTERGRIVELAAGASEWAADAGRATNATGQFEIADERSPEEIAALIRRLGYEPGRSRISRSSPTICCGA